MSRTLAARTPPVKGRRYTAEQVEERMIPQIVEALYPVLIPIEERDIAIQAANQKRITEIARLAWRAFVLPR